MHFSYSFEDSSESADLAIFSFTLYHFNHPSYPGCAPSLASSTHLQLPPYASNGGPPMPSTTASDCVTVFGRTCTFTRNNVLLRGAVFVNTESRNICAEKRFQKLKNKYNDVFGNI